MQTLWCFHFALVVLCFKFVTDCVKLSICHSKGEEHSRVQAHIDDNELSAHILLHDAEYNIEVCHQCPSGFLFTLKQVVLK